MSRNRSAIPWTAVLGALILAPATPTHALRVLLDHDTDGRLDTFENVAVAESVPVDVIVLVEPGDENLDALHSVVVYWGYGGSGDLYCYDSIGSVEWGGIVIPDSPPFVNIEATSCVCLEPRCHCVSEVWLDAQVTGPVAPGYYHLATFVFTRRGVLCGGGHTWPQAVFRLDCYPCGAPGGPNTTMTLNEVFTSVDHGSWGKVKARYR